MVDKEAANRLRRLLAQQLESLHGAGVEQMPRMTAIEPPPPTSGAATTPVGAEPSPVPPSSATPSSASPSSAAPSAVTPAASPPSDATQAGTDAATTNVPGDDTDAYRSRELQVLRDTVCACEKCPELVASRTQTVFGVGNIRPRLCFFGEAPGRDEDQQGEPFVGAAGQLLNKIVQAMSLQREDVYILNVLKCRPPQNRNPEPVEVENCRPYYERQLEILKPEFICCLGAYAARTLLDTDLSVGKMRGQFMRHGDARVLVTYHPAYLLRNESAKRATWEDMQMLMAEMGLKRS